MFVWWRAYFEAFDLLLQMSWHIWAYGYAPLPLLEHGPGLIFEIAFRNRLRWLLAENLFRDPYFILTADRG